MFRGKPNTDLPDGGRKINKSPAVKPLGVNLVLESEFESKVLEVPCWCLLFSIVCMLPIFLLPQCASFTAEQRQSEPSGETAGTVGGERG